MMNVAGRCGVLVGLMLCVVACGESPATPTSPTASTSPPAGPFPDVLRPARVYAFVDAPSNVADYTRASRFVLYDDGSFALQYGRGEYRGTYTEADALIVFQWEGGSAAVPWGATGSLSGDLLSVRYNVIMLLDDFEDAVYARTD